MTEEASELDFLKKNKDEVYLTLEEFQAIDFQHKEGEQFAIINDVLSHLTGVKISN